MKMNNGLIFVSGCEIRESDVTYPVRERERGVGATDDDK